MSIDVSHLSKHFNGFTAVDDVSFSVDTGELVALLGPSGSGKSTLLRMIAGLEIPDAGEISLTGTQASFLSARERNVGFVFQHYALFKHMTVRDNIAFGLIVRKAPMEHVERRVSELLELVQLKGMAKRYPSQLSGGQRQRVAVARALAPEPRVLLLDEPFGALDAKVRSELREWLRHLHEQSRVTTLFVTHDQHEALEVSNRIIVMNRGRIEQEGSPLDVFDRPATPFVAEFVGESNFIEAEVVSPNLVEWPPLSFEVSGIEVGRKVRIYFRLNDVYVSSRPERWDPRRPDRRPLATGHGGAQDDPARQTPQTKALIVESRFKGPVMELHLDIGGGKRILAHVPKGVCLTSGFVPGREVYAGITAFHVFAA